MNDRKMDRWIAGLFSLLLLCFISVPALAAEADSIDFTKTGSVTLTLKSKNTGAAVSGAQLMLVQLAEAENENGSLKYEPVSAFEDWSFDDLSDSSLAGRLAAYISGTTGIEGEKETTNSAGVARFDGDGNGLKLGLYLVVQTGAVSGYSTISPFLVMVPMEENGVWVYDVTGVPKAEPEPTPGPGKSTISITVKKVWSDEDRGDIERPASVTVKLMRGTAVEATVVLDRSNGWTHTWTGLARSSQWTVIESDVPDGYTVSYEETTKGSSYIYTVTNSAGEPDSPDNPDNPDNPDGPDNPDNPDSPDSPDKPDSPDLPQTGQLNWPVPILALAGMALLILGFVLYLGKRKEQDA